MSLYLGNDLISGNKPINLGVRNIGEIVASPLPLTDAGLHLLDGSLILGGGIYQGFVDYIADLYTDNPSANYFTTEALWQQSVNTYGVCGKFVYDSVNNTVRLPKITGIIEGTTDVTALGDLVEAGLPNITGSHAGIYNSEGKSGALYGSYGDGSPWGAPASSSTLANIYIDASRSSSIYGNSSTVQPQTIKAFYYIVIANSTKTDIQVDIDEIATDLNGKADTDLINTTNAGYIKMAKASMPSNRYINLTLGASGSTYTAPADGWFAGWTEMSTAASTYFALRVGGIDDGYASEVYRESGYSFQCPILLPVKKGAVVTAQYTVGLSMFRFYYAVGSESEAQ